MNEETENIESDGPFDPPSETDNDEYYLSDDEEEEKEPTTLTGAMGVAASTPGYSSGGMISTTTISGGAYPPFAPSTTSPYVPTTWTTTTTAATPKKVRLSADGNVKLPSRVTRKVLIAFIDENEEDDEKNIVWAKHLTLEDIDLQITPYEDSKMSITLSLRDVYDNEN